jgi:hypothetical protein
LRQNRASKKPQSVVGQQQTGDRQTDNQNHQPTNEKCKEETVRAHWQQSATSGWDRSEEDDLAAVWCPIGRPLKFLWQQAKLCVLDTSWLPCMGPN